MKPKTDSRHSRGAALVALHRFGDCGAVSILKARGTVYLDAKAARQLARDLARLARSLERESFLAHSFKAAPVPAFAGSSEAGEAAARKRGAV